MEEKRKNFFKGPGESVQKDVQEKGCAKKRMCKEKDVQEKGCAKKRMCKEKDLEGI